MPDNIAQIELFLYRPENIESIFQEVSRRAKDGKRLKLVVRIADTDRTIYEQVIKTKAAREEYKDYLERLRHEFVDASHWRRWWMARRRKKLMRKKIHADVHLLEAALSGLERTVCSKGDIALEPYPQAPLRLVRPEERYDLLETARRAYGVWVWVFEPNEILADSNNLLAWVA
jgi:hypothetical protein